MKLIYSLIDAFLRALYIAIALSPALLLIAGCSYLITSADRYYQNIAKETHSIMIVDKTYGKVDSGIGSSYHYLLTIKRYDQLGKPLPSIGSAQVTQHKYEQFIVGKTYTATSLHTPNPLILLE